MKLENTVINFLGDSITEGVGTSAEDKRYFEVMKKKYNIGEVNGYGIGGTRIARQMDSETEGRWFCSRYNEMKDSADIIVVFGGTNDYGHGDAPLGSFSDRTDETFYGACHTLFSGLINKYPDSVIVIMTPLHRCDENNLYGDGSKKQEMYPLITYVDVIREVAQFYSLPVCDLYSNSGIQPENEKQKELFMPDGLHPNDAGNARIAERLGDFLLSL